MDEPTLDRQTSLAVKTSLVIGAAMIVAGFIWLVVLAADTPTSTRQDDRAGVGPISTPPFVEVGEREPDRELEPPEPLQRALALRLLIDNDMGTGSTEFSAVTLNEELGRLLIADDEGRIFEFDLQPDGEPVIPPRRTIQSRIGQGDIEGLAWLAGSRYAIADEADGLILVVELNDAAKTIEESNVLLAVDTGISGDENRGLEGVAYSNDQSRDVRWLVVAEQPATLLGLASNGELLSSTPLHLADASDVWASNDGVYSVLSDEDRVIIDLDITGSGQPSPPQALTLTFDDGRFEQPEGLVRSRDRSRLYVVGESPGPGQFVFGFWST